jgi:hypothetical protein
MKLVPYKPEYVSGFQAEAYQVGLKEGFPIARQTIDDQIASAIRSDIGGDHQRIHQVNTRYSDIKFKHVLLPVWVSAYRYRDKPFRFIINGQTGEVSGQSPKVRLEDRVPGARDPPRILHPPRARLQQVT